VDRRASRLADLLSKALATGERVTWDDTMGRRHSTAEKLEALCEETLR
jgi:hypothetical protein